jgi:hypothetical protein
VIQKSVIKCYKRLNDLNCYLFVFSSRIPKQLCQDEIIEFLDQAKTRDPEWHETMLNANIDIFEMSHEESLLSSNIWRTWRRSTTPTV